MANTPPRSVGGKHMAMKSALAIARHGKPAFSDILIIEDNQLEMRRLTGTLHSMLGYEIEIRVAVTLGQGLDAVVARKPDLIFLDDHLGPEDRASAMIPFLRRFNYDGPIVIVSGELTRWKAAELLKAGAVVAIHKDQLNSGSIEEALSSVYKTGQVPD